MKNSLTKKYWIWKTWKYMKSFISFFEVIFQLTPGAIRNNIPSAFTCAFAFISTWSVPTAWIGTGTSYSDNQYWYQEYYLKYIHHFNSFHSFTDSLFHLIQKRIPQLLDGKILNQFKFFSTIWKSNFFQIIFIGWHTEYWHGKCLV